MFKPISMLANGLSLQKEEAADHKHSLACWKYPSGPQKCASGVSACLGQNVPDPRAEECIPLPRNASGHIYSY